MKKILYSILIALFIAFTITSNIFAQEAPQWSLPERVKARLGKGAINQIQYSADSTRLAVATSIGIWIYDARTGKELNLFPNKPVSFTSVAFHPDGQMIAAGGKDGVWLWEPKTGTHLRTLTQLANVYSVAFSPDGETIAAGGKDGVWLWEPKTGTHLRTLTQLANVYSVAFSPDGETIASGQDRQTSIKEKGDGTISLWNARTGALLHTIRGDNMRDVGNFTFSPDGQMIASESRLRNRSRSAAAQHNTIHLWNARTGSLLRTLYAGGKGPHQCVSFSPDGQIIATLWNRSSIQLYNPRTGELFRTITTNTNSIMSISFSPDGQTIASADSDGRIRLWDTHTGNHRRTIDGHNKTRFNTRAKSVMFSPDGQIIARINDGLLSVWNAQTNAILWRLYTDNKVSYPVRHGNSVVYHNPTGYVKSAVFSSDGRTIASLGITNSIHLWDANTGKHKRSIRHGDLYGRSGISTFSPDGQVIASESKGDIQLWDANTGKRRLIIPTTTRHKKNLTAVIFSPDGQTIASASRDATICLWDANTGKHKQTLSGHERSFDVECLAFSLDGQTIVSGRDTGIIVLTSNFHRENKIIDLWDANTGKHKQTLIAPTPVFDANVKCLAFSSDGQTIVSGNRDSTIDLWDINTGKHKQTLSGHTDDVDSVAFRPDGLVLASGSSDGTVLLWELPSSTSIAKAVKRDRNVDVQDTTRIRPNLGTQNNTNNLDTFLRQSGGNAFTFDGNRRGLFLGIEIGAGVSVWKYKEYYYDSYQDSNYNWIDNSYTVEYLEGSPAVTMNFKVGYGRSEQTLFYMTGGLVTSGIITAGRFGTDDLLVDLRGGLGVMYFPQEDSKFYYHGSLGYILSGSGRELGTWDTLDPAVSLGVSGGIGYELFSGFNLNATLDYYRWDAEPSDRSTDRWNVFTFSITLSPHLY